MAGRQVATTKPGSTALETFNPMDELPDFLKTNQRGSLGLENMQTQDVGIPQVLLLQPLSKVITEGMQPNAKPGNFWHTGWDYDLGKEFSFIVCRDKMRYLLLAPPDDPRKILARADDGIHWDVIETFDVKPDGHPNKWTTAETVAKSGLEKWGTYDRQGARPLPAATKFFDYLIYLPDLPELGPVVLSLSRSKIKPAVNQLNQKIMQASSRGYPKQAIRFKAQVIQQQGPRGNFFNVQFNMDGRAAENDFNTACDIFDRFEDFRPRDEDIEQDDPDTGGGTEAPSSGKATSTEY